MMIDMVTLVFMLVTCLQGRVRVTWRGSSADMGGEQIFHFDFQVVLAEITHCSLLDNILFSLLKPVVICLCTLLFLLVLVNPAWIIAQQPFFLSYLFWGCKCNYFRILHTSTENP